MGAERMAEFCDYDWAFGAGVLFGLAKGVFTVGNDFPARGPGICGDASREISLMRHGRECGKTFIARKCCGAKPSEKSVRRKAAGLRPALPGFGRWVGSRSPGDGVFL